LITCSFYKIAIIFFFGLFFCNSVFCKSTEFQKELDVIKVKVKLSEMYARDQSIRYLMLDLEKRYSLKKLNQELNLAQGKIFMHYWELLDNWSLDKPQVLDLDKFAHNLVIPAKAGTHSDMQLN